MSVPASSFATPMFFVLTDSHGKYVSSPIRTASYSMTVMAISGLKWIDNYNSNLSVFALLSTPTVHHHLSSASAIMFLIGTNSVRCTPASTIINQIKNIINGIRSNYPHLTKKHCINIVPCFPCFKPIYPLNTCHSLLDNIAQYKNLLFDLSDTLNFTIVAFHVMSHHLGPDRMHLDFRHKKLIERSIITHVESLSVALATSETRMAGRSQEAKARRNKRRHIKLSLKQHQYFLKRPISSSWSLQNVKTYLHEHNIQFAKVPPIFRNTLRIQFNNPLSLCAAENTLSQDAFS